MDRNLVIRCNAGYRYGLGHISRCISLVNEFSNKENYFLIKTDNRELVNSFIESLQLTFNYNIFYIDFNVSVDEDLKTVKTFVNQLNAILILDHYDITTFYQMILKEGNINWLQFDSHAKSNLYAQFVLHASPGATLDLYNPLVKGEEVNLLLGPSYAIIKPEVRSLRNQVKIRESLESIVLSFGGGDDKGMTLRCIELLKKSNLNINVSFTISQVNSDKSEIEDLIANDDQFEIISQNNLSKVMSESDLSIIAPGMTSYESVCLGVPMMLICTADNQLINSVGWSSIGCAINLGVYTSFNEQFFRETLSVLSNNKELISNMSQKCLETVDGLGAYRVKELIKKKYL